MRKCFTANLPWWPNFGPWKEPPLKKSDKESLAVYSIRARYADGEHHTFHFLLSGLKYDGHQIFFFAFSVTIHQVALDICRFVRRCNKSDGIKNKSWEIRRMMWGTLDSGHGLWKAANQLELNECFCGLALNFPTNLHLYHYLDARHGFPERCCFQTSSAWRQWWEVAASRYGN